jgi:TPR repeat protein
VSRRPASTNANLAVLKARLAAAKKRLGYSVPSIALLRQAAALDDVEALEELGMHLRDGLRDRRGRTLVERNGKASLRCYRRAAELGSPSAMEALGNALSSAWTGHGQLPPSPSSPAVLEAIGWYRKAIRLGGDCYNLAVTYQSLGQHKKAVAWFRKSAAGGQVDALLPLAKAELYGVGTARDVLGALVKLQEVAGTRSDGVTQFDREEAMRSIAQVLYDGWLMPRDFKDAVRWLRRAARLGSAAALGLLRDHGESER